MPAQNLSRLSILLLTFFFSASVYASTTWEYLVKTYPLLGNDRALTQTLNKLGKQQWELVNCAKGNAKLTCIFKRPAKGA